MGGAGSGRKKNSRGKLFSGIASSKKLGSELESENESNQPSLAELKGKHVEEKALKDAEAESKHRKRKRLLLEEQEKQSEQLSQGLTLFGGMCLDLICARLPNPLPPTEAEKSLFGQALSEVAAKYAPSMINFAPELMLVTMLAVVVVPRIKTGVEPVSEVPTVKEKEPGDGLDKSGTQGVDDNGQNGKRKDTPSQNDPAAIPEKLDA